MPIKISHKIPQTMEPAFDIEIGKLENYIWITYVSSFIVLPRIFVINDRYFVAKTVLELNLVW